VPVGVGVGMGVGVWLGAEESVRVGVCMVVGLRVVVGACVEVDGSIGAPQANSAKQSAIAPGHLLSRFIPLLQSLDSVDNLQLQCQL
jgi:hypothetical protein